MIGRTIIVRTSPDTKHVAQLILTEKVRIAHLDELGKTLRTWFA